MPIRRPIETFRNFHHHLPYTGRNDYFGSINSSPGMGDAFSIRQLSLKDAAPPAIMTMDEFDVLAYNIRTSLVKGERIKAVPVTDREGSAVSGRVYEIKIDYGKKNIRISMRTDDMKIIEIYPETIYRIDRDTFENLNYVPTINETANYIKNIKS